MEIAALVFDFDGLILDTEWSEFITVQEEFHAHGVPLELDDWRHGVGRADNRHWSDWLLEAAKVPVDLPVVRSRRQVAHRERVHREEVRPGVIGLLDEAEAAGVPVAVASSASADWVESHLERLGLRGRFPVVRCADHVAAAKPAPDLYLLVADLLDVDPARSVALEDSHHGSTAAQAAGFLCVVVPNEVTRLPQFPHADVVVESLAEVDLATLDALVTERDRPARR